MRFVLAVLIAAAATIPGSTQTRPRGRDLGIPFPGQTGPANAITTSPESLWDTSR